MKSSDPFRKEPRGWGNLRLGAACAASVQRGVAGRRVARRSPKPIAVVRNGVVIFEAYARELTDNAREQGKAGGEAVPDAVLVVIALFATIAGVIGKT